MIEPTSHISPPPSSPHSSSRASCNHPHLWIFLLSLCLLIGLFYGLGQLDRHILIIVHSFTHPLIDQIGTIGNTLGEGILLVLVSLGIGAIGLGLHSSSWKFAGLYMLLAHGLSGLLTQLLKHGLSRPRPRIMETVPWNVGFSLESGWDSFPSGHTSSSFSVATVLAYYFPGGRVLWFGLAGYVGLSRVITGAHFPTDVVGGVLVGIGSGLVLVYTRDQWKIALSKALMYCLPWLVAAFALVWILLPHPDVELERTLSFMTGVMLILAGLGLRLWWIREYSTPIQSHGQFILNLPVWPRVLMGLGVAASTGSLIIIGASLMAGIIWWLGRQTTMSPQDVRSHAFMAGLNPLLTETAFGIGMLLLSLLVFFFQSRLFIF